MHHSGHVGWTNPINIVQMLTSWIKLWNFLEASKIEWLGEHAAGDNDRLDMIRGEP